MSKIRFVPVLIVAMEVLASLLLLPGAGHEDSHAASPAVPPSGSPVVEHPGIGGQRVAPAGRDVCWSEPADLNGMIGASEQILAFGLECEIANDFVIDGSAITNAAWWGGYFETDSCDQPYPPGFNLRFYEDADCLPGILVAFVQVTDFTQELVDCVWGLYPIYKWSAGLDLELTSSTRYWFGAQMMDHSFPPQAGRLAAFTVTGCQSVFKGTYFGFPDWTPCDQVFGVPFDASQEFECATPTPVTRSTWGRIRGLYK